MNSSGNFGNDRVFFCCLLGHWLSEDIETRLKSRIYRFFLHILTIKRLYRNFARQKRLAIDSLLFANDKIEGNNEQNIYIKKKNTFIIHHHYKKTSSYTPYVHRQCDNSHKKERFVASKRKRTIHEKEMNKRTRKNIKKNFYCRNKKHNLIWI